MNFYNGYPYQPYYQYQPQIQPAQQQQNIGAFYFVSSQKEAEEWVVGAGQTVFFFDRNNPVFYIKSVSQNGLSQPVEAYDYKQRETASEATETTEKLSVEQFVTKDEFNALKAQIENMAIVEVEG